MVDRLRLFLNRPLRDADRPRLFALAFLLILAAASVLAASDDVGPAPDRGDTGFAAPRPSAVPAASSALSPTPAPTPPSEEGRITSAAVAPPAELARAKRAAHRFLAGYLRFSYGHTAVRTIPAATRGLRTELARTRPRVPRRIRRRRPHVLQLQTDVGGRSRVRLLALVDDGAYRYTVPLALALTPAGWTVTAVAE